MPDSTHNTSSSSLSTRRTSRVWFVGMGAAIVALLVVACIGFVLASGVSQRESFAHAAQDDSALLEEEESTTEVTRAVYPVVTLVDLMNATQNQAIKTMGHGATVEHVSSFDAMGYTKEVTVSLADERADVDAGTPTVVMWLNDSGHVRSASYQAPTSLIGYGSLSFVSAIEQEHIVDYVLSSVGLTQFDTANVALPDEDSYSIYESDKKTLAQESYTFTGNGYADNDAYTWSVTLTYDYTQANETGNLANTIKQVHVMLTPVAE